MNLQENIRKILREEVKQLKDMLKPANPEGVLHHHTTYKFRESIQKNGLLPKVGKQTANYMSYNFPDSEPLPMVFASDPEYGFFGGDVWEIDLSKINNTWYNDPIHEGDGNNFKYYVTLDPIPPSAIKLISSDEQRDNDLDTFRETGKFPNRNPEPEEPKTPEESSKWGDLISQVGDDDTISMDDLFNLKESVRRILREETYSPAGDEYTPGRYVVHKSPKHWRENIELTGLQVGVGDCYQEYVGGDVECRESIFATDSTNEDDMFDSTYDDDIWVIDTECANVTWYKDKHFEGGDYKYHIVTFEDISPDCLELIHEGTGKSW